MNILFLTPGNVRMPPQRGASLHIIDFNIAKQLVQIGHSVTILDRRYSPEDPEIEYSQGVRIVRLTAPKFNLSLLEKLLSRFKAPFLLIAKNIADIPFIFKVRQYVNQHLNHFDIIHTHFIITGIMVSFLNKKVQKKLVFTSGIPHEPSKRRILDLDWLFPYLEFWLMRRVSKIAVQSEFWKQKAVSEGKIRPEKIAVIPPGVDTMLFTPKALPREVKKELQIDKSSLILFVGAFIPRKGVDYLVKAADILINEWGYKDILFLAIGPHLSPAYVKYIQDIIKERNIDQNFLIKGEVSQDELPTYYNASDIVVSPSLSESFGMPICEAMTCGKPVVATSTVGAKLQVKDGYNGFLVKIGDPRELADKIRYLIDHPEERERMGINARRQAGEYDWAKIAAKHLEHWTN